MDNLLFWAHTLRMSYATKALLLVGSSVSSKQLLCFLHGQGQEREQKHSTKNFVEFHDHSPRLNMLSSFCSLRSSSRTRPSRASRSLCRLFLSRALKNREAVKSLRVMQRHYYVKIFTCQKVRNDIAFVMTTSLKWGSGLGWGGAEWVFWSFLDNSFDSDVETSDSAVNHSKTYSN